MSQNKLREKLGIFDSFIGFVSLIVAIFACLAAVIVIPEVREFFSLDSPNALADKNEINSEVTATNTQENHLSEVSTPIKPSATQLVVTREMRTITITPIPPTPTTNINLIPLTTIEPTFEVQTGYTGVVLEKLHDGYGQTISDVHITFVSEDFSNRFETVSRDNGRYFIDLIPARYYVITDHPSYKSYDLTKTGGFAVLFDEGVSWGNLFLEPLEGTLKCPSSGHFPRNYFGSYSVDYDTPPTTTLSVSPNPINIGDEISIIVASSDDKGINSIGWWAEQSNYEALGGEHWFECNGQVTCTHTWKISTEGANNPIIITANSRDTSYPTSMEAHDTDQGFGMPCVTIED